ncbi:sigma-54-dependent Fis family transcriptional regulator [bacterium]|nr:sigma-54-dependent Fis family transcriptional regulator [bacterium]
MPNHARILVVDDDASQRSLLECFLRGRGYEVLTADTGEAALAILSSEAIDMVISDVRMPGISGLETLRRARQSHAVLPVLLVTAYADIRDAVGAMRDGAVNYLEKPIDLDELLATVQAALGPREAPPPWLPAGLRLPEHVVARSPLTREVFRQAALVAPSDARVLITGESGVGKEVVADVIHLWSPRARGPFLKVNCAAIPESLLESELFGHEKGAFTGAVGRRAGRFEEAEGGSILLDEIAEMSPALQAKLLRVTQDGSFERVGSNERQRSNVRILASTNRNLEAEVAEGRFREDLFFRLNVVEIYVPPLRERQADILELAHLFAERFAKRKLRFSAAFATCLELYDWPGNVRELANALERAVLLAGSELLLPEHLPRRIQKAGVASTDADAPAKGTRMVDMERSLILSTLREHNFSRTETARTLGMSRRALLYKLRRYAEEGYDVGSRS